MADALAVPRGSAAAAGGRATDAAAPELGLAPAELVAALDPLVQTDVRLGLIAPRAAVAVSRLPRGNQQAASAVVVRRGLTFRQTEALVDDASA